MPVSITLGSRFKGGPVASESENNGFDSFGDLMWSFLVTMFPHLLSIGIGVFLIYLNKKVNDRNETRVVETTETKSHTEVEVETRQAPVERAPRQVPVAPRQAPLEPVVEAPRRVAVPARKPAPARVAAQAPVQKPAPARVAAPAPAPKPAPVPEAKPAPEPEPEEEPEEKLAMLTHLMKKSPPVDMVSVDSTQSTDDHTNSACLQKLKTAFPNAIPNLELISKVADALEEFGYGETTLLATSLCCDEVNRVLDEQFHKVYEHHFSMGGLAGFPFGGVTSFGAMAHHIPDGGSCLIVYGPHVGIDSTGAVGMIDRRGRKNNGACCGSAADAANHVAEVRGSIVHKGPKAPIRPLDAQQAFVRSMLMPYGKRLENSTDAKVEVPYALYDAMDDMMRQIVTFGAGEVAGEGKIALLGGIQINTPEEHSDYFLPLTFEIRDNHNLLIENLMWW